MRKIFLVGIFVLGVALVSIYFFFPKNEISKVCLAEKCFAVELAKTPAAREAGLMNRTSLGEKSGMLFVFDSAEEYNFWMKNTLIPLDIIWIDENLKVVAVKTAEPCREDFCEVYAPDRAALYVLEVNAGEAEKNNVKVGDSARFIKSA